MYQPDRPPTIFSSSSSDSSHSADSGCDRSVVVLMFSDRVKLCTWVKVENINATS